MTNCIEIKGLCKSYPDFALDHIDLTVPGGSILGLIGENGAGKSTTIKCILNLVRWDAGSIRILGQDNIERDVSLKQDIGVVLDECFFHDNLRASDVDTILRRVYKRWDRDLFSNYCRQFGLPEKKTIKEYSRGMKMKLSLAAALAHRPRLLILDEATSGLDPVVRDEILDEFLSFIQDEDHGILLSSHITSDLEKAADYITYIHRGRVTLSGAKDELLEQYGRLVCRASDLEKLDKSLVVGVRKSQFGCEALVNDRAGLRKAYPELTVDPVSLEDIMVFTVKGEIK
ncbi:MAG: ABC transporter ATP-binding protein [Oscillospiraceae bacterium]|nr:ABC transporter ATP-binding protein [Oscillospiraceae bacterium]